MAINNNKSIPELTSEINDVKSQLDAVPNYNSGGSDAISNETSFERLQKKMQSLQSQRQIARWYGNKDKSVREGASSPGIIGSSLNWLTKPLYGVVGATKHFTGLGKGSLMSDIADNMQRTKDTFGNVLTEKGMSHGVAAPLGFALDIFADPINWATMGSSAFIPRLGVGAYEGLRTGEGVVKGLSSAAKSGLLEKTTTLGRFTPFFNKTSLFNKLGKKSLQATADWEAFSGRTAEDMLVKTGRQGVWKQSLDNMAKKVIEDNPRAGKLMEHLVYDPIGWVRRARMKDIVQNALGVDADISGALKAIKRGESAEPYIAKEKAIFAKKVEEMPFNEASASEKVNELFSNSEINDTVNKLEAKGMARKIEELSAKMVNEADDAVSIARDTTNKYITTDGVENADRMLQDATDITNSAIKKENLTLDDIKKIMTSGVMEDTGIKWFDKMMAGIKNYTVNLEKVGGPKVVNVGKRVMEAYDKSMAIFRVSKVAASPTSWINAVVGNLTMTYMAGGSISPKFLQRLSEAKNVFYSSSAEGRALMDRILIKAGGGLEEDSIRKFLLENSTGARGTFGDLSFIGNSAEGIKGLSEYVDNAMKKYTKETGISVENQKVRSAIEEIKANAKKDKIRIDKKAERDYVDASHPNKSNAEYTRDILNKKGTGNVSDLEKGTGMVSNEFYNSESARKMFDFIADKAKENPNNPAYKALNAIFNKMPSGYEKIDQAYKLATFVSATVDGYSLPELRRLAKFVNINPEEITKIKVAGQLRYQLHPRTAMELANVMYLNYAAMPAAIRVMRNFPLIGSPFVSFMYGMALKTGQTIAYNPSAFNKIGFMMDEIGGAPSPLEKQVLATDKYSYLTKPGMMRLPFFEKNPIYMNMANILPYYSLNMFNPSGASYGNSIREKLVDSVQSSPVFKDPVGSLIFDYLIQPLILDEATRPQGQFGQSLYPSDANFLGKVAYGARSLGEAYVPNITSIAGLLTPDAAAEFIPSYRWRQLAEAKVGKNAVGVKGKEPTSSRTVRALLNYAGIPVQTPVNKTYVDRNKK